MICQHLDKIPQILRDLELDVLRSRFRRQCGPAALHHRTENRTARGNSYFYLSDYGFAKSREERQQQAKEADAINSDDRFWGRAKELAQTGIWPRVVSNDEPWCSQLSVIVEFNEEGRKTLEGDG